MSRFMNAFTALLFGCGILVFCVGLFSDQYKWQYGSHRHGRFVGDRLRSAGLPGHQERRLEPQRLA